LREAGVWLGHPLTKERVGRVAAWLERVPCYALRYANLPAAAEHIDRLVDELRRAVPPREVG
jgi:hypothetical protein